MALSIRECCVQTGDRFGTKGVAMETAIRRDLPCSNPHLVEGYISIAEIMEGGSCDFIECDDCGIVWCECHLDDKREDESYKLLVKHFADGGAVNRPVYRYKGEQSNGHHRIIAAMDAGFTHVPYLTRDGWQDDWADVDAEQYGFKVVTDRWGDSTVFAD